MKKFYAVYNPYKMANTAEIYVFASKKCRDAFIDLDPEATEAIKRADITKELAEEPRPFSGQAYVIDRRYGVKDAGMIGRVLVGYPDEGDYIERLF